MKRGEIWIASLEPRKGAEVGKQRPVLIVQTDLLNDVNHPTSIVLPISSKKMPENILRFQIENSALKKRSAYVLVDQLRAVDAQSRLKKNIGKITKSEMSQIEERLKQVLDLPY